MQKSYLELLCFPTNMQCTLAYDGFVLVMMQKSYLELLCFPTNMQCTLAYDGFVLDMMD
jgi:hypothetical protein